MKNAVFWDVTPYGSCKNRRYSELHLAFHVAVILIISLLLVHTSCEMSEEVIFSELVLNWDR
jgi:hypothetical protein